MGAEGFDLAVVGAGPGGLAAAATAVLGGLRVVVVDAGLELGGQFWRHPPQGSALPPSEDLHHGLVTYRSLVRTLRDAERAGRCTLLLQHQVWTATGSDDGVVLHLLDRAAGPGRERARQLTVPRLVLTTGAFDRSLPFPGWDLPGVYTAGGLQALLKGGGVRAGSRVVVGGTGPFLLPVATGLAGRGAEVVVCEANDPLRWTAGAGAALGVPGKLLEGAGYAAALVRHRVAVHVRTAVVAAHGTDRVEAVTLARLDRDGTVVQGSQRRVAADAVGTGWGFTPQLDLPVTLGAELRAAADGNQVVRVDDDQRTSLPGVYAAGEVCGVGGAELALREGQLAGEAVLHDLGRAPVTDPAGLRRVRGRVERHRRFADAMAEAHPVPERWTGWLDDATLVCRCEEVDAGTVREAVAGGALGARQVKQLTRAGMGWCQGRVCATAVGCLAGGPAEVPERLVAGPVPLGALADAAAGALHTPQQPPHRPEPHRPAPHRPAQERI